MLFTLNVGGFHCQQNIYNTFYALPMSCVLFYWIDELLFWLFVRLTANKIPMHRHVCHFFLCMLLLLLFCSLPLISLNSKQFSQHLVLYGWNKSTNRGKNNGKSLLLMCYVHVLRINAINLIIFSIPNQTKRSCIVLFWWWTSCVCVG